MMGSSELEAGRGPDELQHEVTLTHDYWLAETECTQPLWQLVMDDSPSYFVSEERPGPSDGRRARDPGWLVG